MTSYPRPMCYSCTHYEGGDICTSFPDGIPVDILESRFDHRQPMAGEEPFEQDPNEPTPDFTMFGDEDDEIEDYTSVPMMATATSAWNTDARKKAAAKGHALPDGSYPIKDKADWYKARQAIGRGGKEKRAQIISHLKKRGRALGIPDSELDELGGQG